MKTPFNHPPTPSLHKSTGKSSNHLFQPAKSTMPRHSERKTFIRELQFLLVTCVAWLQINEQHHRGIVTGQHFPFFCIMILALLEHEYFEAPNEDLLLILVLVLLLRSRLRTKHQLIRFRCGLWEARTTHTQAEGILRLITMVCNQRYLAPRVACPRIATISRTFEVLSENSDTVFLRWVSFFFCIEKLFSD